METLRKFNIADILTITDGRLISPRHMEGVYDILNYMTGDSLMTHQLGRAGKECTPHLLEQYPRLGSDDVKFKIDTLCVMLKENPKEDHKNLILGWSVKLAEFLGYDGPEVEVIQIKEEYEPKEPLRELAEMMGGTERIIPVIVGKEKA